MKLYIGMMSGTSVDGVDAVLVDFSNGINVIADYMETFPADLKSEIDKMLKTFTVSFSKLGEIDHRLGLFYAHCISKLLKKAELDSSQVEAIGCHGQTVFHAPDGKYPFTIQLGNGNIVAAKTGIPTVMDFRRMDMAFGGEGAPLAPAFHQSFFSKQKSKRAVVNLGGIANVSILAETDDGVIGFDTGPANCLMDGWINQVKGKNFDDGGTWAKSGNIVNELLNKMLAEDYFALPAPKSTGRELFNMRWLSNILQELPTFNDNDIQATLLELTAITVSDAIKSSAPDTQEVYVCGGGAYNTYLLERLAHHLPDTRVGVTNELGVSEKLVEAVGFAWLAKERIEKSPSNLSSVTGASRKVLQGVIYEY